MAEEREVRIILRRAVTLDLKAELSAYDPSTGREVRTRYFVPASQIENEIQKLRQIFLRSGCRVTFKEM